MSDDTYRTVAGAADAEITVDGSRFWAAVRPAHDRDGVRSTLETIRGEAHDATHHCSAYRLGREGDTFHYDDDGEPSGTAGRPILRQIDGRNVTNTLVVVARYFGGTKLGTGGLARAYGRAAGEALDRAGATTCVVRVPLRIRYRYEDTNPAEQILRRFDVEEVESTYTDVTEKTVAVRKGQAVAFREAFRDALGGRGEICTPPERE